MAKLYGEILVSGNLRINPKKLFSNLTVNEEALMTRELINFCIWSNRNIEKIADFLKNKQINLYTDLNEVNCQILTEFWLQTLAKPTKVEELLNNFQVTTDSYTYICRYYNRIILLQTEEDFIMVSKAIHRTEEQKQVLIRISQSRFGQELSEILIKQKRDIDHIDKNYATKIIEYFRKKQAKMARL